MRTLLILFTIVSTGFASCKTNKTTASTSAEQQTPQTTGKVSHQYKETGCATVVIIKNGDETITLIPKDKLPDSLDVDGKELTFDYRTLKMHNPAGCNVGMPAELTNVKPKR